MKKILFILYIMVVQVKLVSQPVTCNLSIRENETVMQPFGLLNLVVATTLADTAQGTWGMGYPTIQYQRGMSEWRDIASIPPSYEMDGGSDGKYLTFQPDISFVFLDTYPENVITEDSTFKNGGLFQIRVKLEVFQNWYPFHVYSNTLSIQFDEIPTDELAALELVRQNIALEDCLIHLTSSTPTVSYTAYPTLQQITDLYPATIIGQHAMAQIQIYKCKTGNENYVYDNELLNNLNIYLSEMQRSKFKNIRHLADILELCIEGHF